MIFAKADLCSFGLRSQDGQELLRKPISLLTNSMAFSENIEKTCTGDHAHRVIQGTETAHSAAYPTAFATAVFRAYEKTPMSLGKTTKAIFATSSSSSSSSSSSAALAPNPPGPTDLVTGDHIEPIEEEKGEVEEPHGSRAISFKGKVSPEVASVLKKVHQNLGHPSNRDLVKHLRIAGADKNILQAAEQLVCRTCARSSKAPLHNISAPVAALDFNEAVTLDVIWLGTTDARNRPALNVVDLASTYQVVIPLDSTKSEAVSNAFVSGWIQWAGAPRFVLVDLDSAFKDKFLTLMDERSIIVRAAAGQAHWQNGVAERHGGAWKAIWAKLVEDHLVFEEEIPEAAAMVSDAKNQLRNRSGYSPRQWVFGSNGRQAPDIFDMDDTQLEMVDLASPDSKFARAQVLRAGAKAAFYACQSKEAVQRAMNHKPRIDKFNYEVGDLVYAYRQMRQGKGKKPKSTWLGPGVVIGREGSALSRRALHLGSSRASSFSSSRRSLRDVALEDSDVRAQTADQPTVGG